MTKQNWLNTRSWRAVITVGLLLALSACVTVNIYFPAAAAKRLADQVVGEVYKAADSGAAVVPAAPTHSNSAVSGPTASAAPSAFERITPTHVAGYLLATAFSAVSTTAEASADLNAMSPGVQAARAQLEAIATQMRPYFVSGAVGWTADGLVAIHDAAAVPLQQRAALTGLVSSNNRALQNLYQQIANANGHPEWEGQIQQTFAQTWISKAPAGYWYQSPSNQWQKK
jgi:uncharacterized protein YdbL (DUF1318 family)